MIVFSIKLETLEIQRKFSVRPRNILFLRFLWSRYTYSSFTTVEIFVYLRVFKKVITSSNKHAILFPNSESSCEIFYPYSYTGVPSDLNRLIRLPPLPEPPELSEKDDSVSMGFSSGSLRLRDALVPKRIATRKAKIPAVTAYMNVSSAIMLLW